jgi:hypothetical protein
MVGEQTSVDQPDLATRRWRLSGGVGLHTGVTSQEEEEEEE